MLRVVVTLLLFTALLGSASSPLAQTLEKSTNAPVSVTASVSEKNKALISAAESGNLEAVKRLLDIGAQADALDEKGIPVIFYSTRGGNLEVLKTLLAAGAKADARVKSQDKEADGLQPIHVIGEAKTKSVEFAKVLVAAGARIDAKTGSGFQPVHAAAIADNGTPLLQYLLDAGADANAKADDGLTPLEVAVSANKVDSASLLLARGARADIVVGGILTACGVLP